VSDAERDRLRDHEDADASIDLTLVDEMLAMSVEERLRQNDRMLRTVEQLRAALSPDDGSPPDDRHA